MSKRKLILTESQLEDLLSNIISAITGKSGEFDLLSLLGLKPKDEKELETKIEKDEKITKNDFKFQDVDISKLKKINFSKIPSGTNNYRSAEPSKEVLGSIINKFGIKNVIRFNGEGSDSDGLSIAEEKKICEILGCKFYKLSATRDQDKVNQLLDSGNTLVHCHHGADRTGGNVGGWLYKKGWGDTKKIWDYTIQYNGWRKMVKNSPNKFVNGGYLKQAQKFGVKDLKHAQELN